MGVDTSWDAIVFGELVFPAGGVARWTAEVGERLEQLAAFDARADEEIAQVLVTQEGVAIRAWFFSASFQAWCTRLEAMFAHAARLGARGDVTFVGVGEGPAYRLNVAGGRAHIERIPAPGFEHPTIQEVALAVDYKAERRRHREIEARWQAETERTHEPAALDAPTR